LTGGVLVVGLIHGRDRAEEAEVKAAVHAKAGEFARRFAAANGALRCQDIIGLDVSTEEGVEAYYARNLQEETCTGVVRNAVRALLGLLDEWGAGQG
jgi:hypothetical protein